MAQIISRQLDVLKLSHTKETAMANNSTNYTVQTKLVHMEFKFNICESKLSFVNVMV